MDKFLYHSPLGQLIIEADENYLYTLSFSQEPSHRIFNDKELHHSPPSPLGKEISAQLNGYFATSRQEFHIPFKLKGTAFQLQVWESLSKIPYGSTRSYQEIAEEIQNPKAVRAVGSANGKNPILLILPCHRVIQKSGALGGYVAGTKRKQQLLDLESKATSQNR